MEILKPKSIYLVYFFILCTTYCGNRLGIFLEKPPNVVSSFYLQHSIPANQDIVSIEQSTIFLQYNLPIGTSIEQFPFHFGYYAGDGTTSEKVEIKNVTYKIEHPKGDSSQIQITLPFILAEYTLWYWQVDSIKDINGNIAPAVEVLFTTRGLIADSWLLKKTGQGGICTFYNDTLPLACYSTGFGCDFIEISWVFNRDTCSSYIETPFSYQQPYSQNGIFETRDRWAPTPGQSIKQPLPNSRSFEGPIKSSVGTNNFIINDLDTSLTWKVCAEGQKEVYDGNTITCVGSSSDLTLAEAISVCSNLNILNNGRGYAGINYWRLPFFRELDTLVDYGSISNEIGVVYPLINTAYFNGAEDSIFWTASGVSSSIGFVRTVTFSFVQALSASLVTSKNRFKARCVANPFSTTQLTKSVWMDHNNNTVSNTTMKLMWQKYTAFTKPQDSSVVNVNYSTTSKPVAMRWEEGLKYCSDLTLGGYTNWRLPNINELKSLTILDRNAPRINTLLFLNIEQLGQTAFYWSSTTANHPDSGVVYQLYDGYVFPNGNKIANNYYVRCVRSIP